MIYTTNKSWDLCYISFLSREIDTVILYLFSWIYLILRFGLSAQFFNGKKGWVDLPCLPILHANRFSSASNSTYKPLFRKNMHNRLSL